MNLHAKLKRKGLLIIKPDSTSKKAKRTSSVAQETLQRKSIARLKTRDAIFGRATNKHWRGLEWPTTLNWLLLYYLNICGSLTSRSLSTSPSLIASTCSFSTHPSCRDETKGCSRCMLLWKATEKYLAWRCVIIHLIQIQPLKYNYMLNISMECWKRIPPKWPMCI